MIIEPDLASHASQIVGDLGDVEDAVRSELPELERSPVQCVVALVGRRFSEPVQLTPACCVRICTGAINVGSRNLMYGWFCRDAVCGLGCRDQSISHFGAEATSMSSNPRPSTYR